MPAKSSLRLPFGRRVTTCLAAGAAVLSLGIVHAHADAALSQVSGEVMVNAGAGFKVVEGPVKLRSGDQVLVSPGGTAHVSLASGCAIPVGPGEILTIADEMPCEAAGAKGNGFALHSQAAFGGVAAGAGGAGAGAAGAAGAAGVAGAAGGAIAAGGIGISAAAVAAGVAVAAAVGVAVSTATGDTNDDRPTSP